MCRNGQGEVGRGREMGAVCSFSPSSSGDGCGRRAGDGMGGEMSQFGLEVALTSLT